MSKWKAEALAVPDKEWILIATRDKDEWVTSSAGIEGIIDEETFETVRQHSIASKMS